MISLINIELYKIFKKWRSYIGFIAIGILVPIVHIAMFFEGQHTLSHLTENLKQNFVFVGNLLNGYLIAYLILISLIVQIPFLIALVAGDLLAGEASAGTYRMLITRPVSRTKLVTAKFIAGIIYSNLLVLWLVFTSLGIGIIIFGTGELIVVQSTIYVFAQDDILWRFALAYGSGALAMSLVASLAFLFSSLVENSIGPIISTMAVIIIFTIISALTQVEFFKMLKPYLFTNYMQVWRYFFEQPVDYYLVFKSWGILIGHIVVFFSATLIIFNRKDILS
ncbi:MAG: hypothetical protein C0425_05510 [Chlorobiaceae bacterium]|nr:hypothetical protein [Chlorobiaceae bacterium]MBA4309775.1 hypothetical protein [Chlorobiaceae bacterium]